ncbi:hypothetical protein [uncultured Shimia sp.]|uniref:hypothetical protein n=1 Tax=uncultured Shimia sp. TaxID=573152 RepID=UPI0026339417|nr:hypothetical protein [uncultured Shimia sp.]
MAARLKAGGTHLTSIPKHLIWCECACGHHASLPVPVLLALSKPPETVAQAVERARCRRCGQHKVKDYRLVYHGDGAARDAMLGADINRGGTEYSSEQSATGQSSHQYDAADVPIGLKGPIRTALGPSRPHHHCARMPDRTGPFHGQMTWSLTAQTCLSQTGQDAVVAAHFAVIL